MAAPVASRRSTGVSQATRTPGPTPSMTAAAAADPARGASAVAGGDVAERCEALLERVRAVRVVDDDERPAVAPEPLHAPGGRPPPRRRSRPPPGPATRAAEGP